MIPATQANVQATSMTNRNQVNTVAPSLGSKHQKGSRGNVVTTNMSGGSKNEGASGVHAPMSGKKRKLSESHMKLRGLNNNITNANGLANSELSRSQQSRGQSRGVVQSNNGAPVPHDRLSQTGFSSCGPNSQPAQPGVHRNTNGK